MESIVCKLCDYSHLSPSPINERRVHPGMTAIERAYQAPFGLLLAGSIDLINYVGHRDAEESVVDEETGHLIEAAPVEMQGDWGSMFLSSLHNHPVGAAEA